MLQVEYAQKRPLSRLDVADTNTKHKSRLGSYQVLAEYRRMVRDMQALKDEQKKRDLPRIDVAHGDNDDDDLFRRFVALPELQSERLSVPLANEAGQAFCIVAHLGRTSSGCHDREEMEARLLGVHLHPLRR